MPVLQGCIKQNHVISTKRTSGSLHNVGHRCRNKRATSSSCHIRWNRNLRGAILHISPFGFVCIVRDLRSTHKNRRTARHVIRARWSRFWRCCCGTLGCCVSSSDFGQLSQLWCLNPICCCGFHRS